MVFHYASSWCYWISSLLVCIRQLSFVWWSPSPLLISQGLDPALSSRRERRSAESHYEPRIPREVLPYMGSKGVCRYWGYCFQAGLVWGRVKKWEGWGLGYHIPGNWSIGWRSRLTENRELTLLKKNKFRNWNLPTTKFNSKKESICGK